MSSNYDKGRRFEYRVRDFFKKLGYYVVRSAGSHGIADLVCVKNDDSFMKSRVALVQCKYGSGKMSKKEVEEFDELCKKMYAAGYIAMVDDKGHLWFKFLGDISEVEEECLEMIG